MYLSHVDNSEYVMAIELDDSFLKYIKEIEQKLLETNLDIAIVEITFDATKARLIEDGFYPYEDRQIHAITNGEDPLDYYRFHISKYYFPKEEYWEELKPDKVYLKFYNGNFFGFRFIKNTINGREDYEGISIRINDWEHFLS
jgi:hypothetical protein